MDCMLSRPDLKYRVSLIHRYAVPLPPREGRRIPKQFRFLHSYYSRVALLKRSFTLFLCVAPLQNAVLPLRSPFSLTFPLSHFPREAFGIGFYFSTFNFKFSILSAPLASSLGPRPRALVPLFTVHCQLSTEKRPFRVFFLFFLHLTKFLKDEAGVLIQRPIYLILGGEYKKVAAAAVLDPFRGLHKV